MKKSKMILLFMLAILISVAGNAKGQEVKLIKQYNFYKQFQYGVTYFNYNESSNKIYLGSPTSFKIYNVASDTFEVNEENEVEIKVSKYSYFRRNGNEINKIDPFSNQKIFTFSYSDNKIIMWNLSEDGNHLILMTEKTGTKWYKECELLVYNTLTNDIDKQLTYQLNLEDDIPDQIRNFLMSIKVSSDLKYGLIDWGCYKDYLKPYSNGIMGIDIVNLETNQRIHRLNNQRSICLSTTSDTLVVSNWQWKEYEIGNSFSYDSSNVINIQSGIPLLGGKKIQTGNSNHISGNFLITTNDRKLFCINLTTMKSDYLPTDYRISDFVIHNYKLIACDNEGGYKIAIYDISNITGVNEPRKVVLLYPNPTSHLLNLEIDKCLEYNVQIIDETGKILDSFPIYNSYQLNYNTTRLPKGMYILQLNSKISSVSYKFLKD
ncbi:MAG: T9SS type A sorting domain-containing protein [bacterium]